MAKRSDKHEAVPKSTSRKKVSFTKKDARLLPKFSLAFFDRPRLTALVCIAVFAFGLLSYTTLLKREGFPQINFPVSSISGAYFVNDATAVDKNIARPISQVALDTPGVASVNAQSFPNFFTISITYDEGTDARAASAQIEQAVASGANIPPQAQLQFSVPYFGATGGSLEKIDVGISFFAKDNQSTADIAAKAEMFANELKNKNLPLVADAFVVNPFKEAQNPLTGQSAVVQQSFDRFGERSGQPIENTFYNSVLVGVSQKDGSDLLKFDKEVRQASAEIIADPQFNGYGAFLSASLAPNIEDNISELQRELVIALIAVLIVGSLVIAVRASVITVLSMVLVIFAVLGLLYVLGYSLNVITLFALILSLALIVDDTIIMVEAIDAQRKRQKDARRAVEEATRKVSRAMISATSTAALSFAPLLFVGGILGSFIRAIPVTVIASLLLSLLVALVFIPFISKFILLRKETMGEEGVVELAAGFERRVARGISKPMLWAKGSIKRLTVAGLTALIIGFGFIGLGGFIAQKVNFNIFPASKDANNLIVAMTFPAGTSLSQAEAIADQANNLIGSNLGENFEFASYYNSGNERGANLTVKLVSYNDRSERSPQIIAELQQALDDELPTGVKARVSQQDAGPPATPFVVAIVTDDRDRAYTLAEDVAEYLQNLTVTRTSGKEANVTNVTVSQPVQIDRVDGKQRVTVSAEFDGSDTSALFVLAQNAVEQEFPPERVASYGLASDALQFDLGQESENQNSFRTLAIAFPLLLCVIYLLLAIQFRSILQPLLIYMAIPFSFFGIALSLYLTDNPFSFFAMLGFFALIGLSIKNTILLTDYANQARRAGMGAVDAIVEALGERFRPLVATSLTAIVALVPLAIISPFWQGLVVIIIFGLLSSTLLVVTVFPYYYLGSEFLRSGLTLKQGLGMTVGMFAIIAATIAAGVAIGLAAPIVGLLVVLELIGTIIFAFRRSLSQRRHS